MEHLDKEEQNYSYKWTQNLAQWTMEQNLNN
jgi:hypothetical protein